MEQAYFRALGQQVIIKHGPAAPKKENRNWAPRPGACPQARRALGGPPPRNAPGGGPPPPPPPRPPPKRKTPPSPPQLPPPSIVCQARPRGRLRSARLPEGQNNEALLERLVCHLATSAAIPARFCRACVLGIGHGRLTPIGPGVPCPRISASEHSPRALELRYAVGRPTVMSSRLWRRLSMSLAASGCSDCSPREKMRQRMEFGVFLVYFALDRRGWWRRFVSGNGGGPAGFSSGGADLRAWPRAVDCGRRIRSSSSQFLDAACRRVRWLWLDFR